MAKTHVAPVVAARQMKVFVNRASDIPDEYIPNSFRLMRDFVNTLDDMPHGTMESILANPYFLGRFAESLRNAVQSHVRMQEGFKNLSLRPESLRGVLFEELIINGDVSSTAR